MVGQSTRGVFFVHSAPKALCSHVEWAINSVIGSDAVFDWTPQPAAPGMFRSEVSWVGEVGTGARLASAMRGWEHLRYEVTEEPGRGSDGARWSHTPGLGIFHSVTDAHGNNVVPEDRVRAALEFAADPPEMQRRLQLAIGQAWDEELEPFRYAGAGAPVRWLHRVG